MLGWELDRGPLALVDAPDLVVVTVNSTQSTLNREAQPEEPTGRRRQDLSFALLDHFSDIS